MIGQTLSLIGDRLSYLALIAILAERTARFHSAGAGGSLSGLALALLLPSVLFAPWVALRLDRWRRRDVLISADLARAAVMLAMALALPTLRVPALLALVFAGSVANVFFLPARIAVVPELVETPRLAAANALGVLAAVVATVLGTLAGGPLLAAMGPRAALALAGASFLLSAATLLRLPRGELPAAPAGGPGSSAWPALRSFGALLRTPALRAATALLLSTWLAGALLHVCGTLRLQAVSARVTDLLAPTLAALGAGGALGALLFGSRLGAARSVKVAAGLAAAGAALALFALLRGAPGIAGAAFIAGLASAPIYILADTEIQESVPRESRGGALAARDFLCKAGFLVAALWLGAAVQPSGAPAALAAGGAVLIAMGCYFGVRRPLRS